MLRYVVFCFILSICTVPKIAEAALINVSFSGQDSGHIGLSYIGGGYQVSSGLGNITGNATIEVGDGLKIGLMSEVKSASLEFDRLSSISHSGFSWQYESSPSDSLHDIGWAQTWDYTGQFSSDELIVSVVDYFKWLNAEGTTVSVNLKLTFGFETSTFPLYVNGNYELSDFGQHLIYGMYELSIPTGTTSTARYTGRLTSFNAEDVRAVAEPSSVLLTLAALLSALYLRGGRLGSS